MQKTRKSELEKSIDSIKEHLEKKSKIKNIPNVECVY